MWNALLAQAQLMVYSIESKSLDFVKELCKRIQILIKYIEEDKDA